MRNLLNHLIDTAAVFTIHLWKVSALAVCSECSVLVTLLEPRPMLEEEDIEVEDFLTELEDFLVTSWTLLEVKALPLPKFERLFRGLELERL